jgi:hypothetical protein
VRAWSVLAARSGRVWRGVASQFQHNFMAGSKQGPHPLLGNEIEAGDEALAPFLQLANVGRVVALGGLVGDAEEFGDVVEAGAADEQADRESVPEAVRVDRCRDGCA